MSSTEIHFTAGPSLIILMVMIGIAIVLGIVKWAMDKGKNEDNNDQSSE